MNLRFGLLWPFRNPEWARVGWDSLYRSHLDLIVESERMGFDEAWLTEHHFVDDGYSPSLLPIGAAIAARTHRIRIGTFLLLLPLHNPVRVAEDGSTSASAWGTGRASSTIRASRPANGPGACRRT
jgi:alkanesulfonate monooxygenase SsuD/methylene tetrahydromethanopterin reductase-like flavin-dependent oxidoreductase (luciferase family)